MPSLSSFALLLVLLGAFAGGVVQGTLGFGGAYIAVPVLAVVAPQLVPGAVLVGIAPLLVLLAVRERASIDRSAFVTISLARVPGIAVGTVVVAAVSTTVITVVVATCLLLAVAATVAGWELRPTPWTRRIVGAVSGFTGTSAALGGPPMALLYQRAGAADRRGTLSAIFCVGTLLAIVSLAAAGEIGRQHLPVGVVAGVGLLLGSTLAPRLNRRLSDETLRRGVLVWAAVGGVVAAVRVVVGG